MISTKISLFVFVPLTVRRAFAQAEEAQSSEEDMWREVIARAVLDALGITGLQSAMDEHLRAVEDARRWFRSSTNRELVFSLAGIEDMKSVCRVMGETPALTVEQQRASMKNRRSNR